MNAGQASERLEETAIHLPAMIAQRKKIQTHQQFIILPRVSASHLCRLMVAAKQERNDSYSGIAGYSVTSLAACNENKYHENFQIRDLPSRNEKFENLNPRNIATIRYVMQLTWC